MGSQRVRHDLVTEHAHTEHNDSPQCGDSFPKFCSPLREAVNSHTQQRQLTWPASQPSGAACGWGWSHPISLLTICHFLVKHIHTHTHTRGLCVSGKESTCNARNAGLIPGSGRSPGGEMAIHFSILAWKIPWTEKPGRLQSMGSQKNWM